MKQPIKEIFSFTKAERRGVFVLLLFIIVLLILNIYWPNNTSDLGRQFAFQEEVEKYLKKTEKKELHSGQNHSIEKISKPQTYQSPRKLSPRPFDPNLMTYEQWLQMGLTKKQAKTIENYKSKGGRFRKAEDFQKIYTISETDYQLLEPYIIINDMDDFIDEPLPLVSYDINLVSIEEIQSVKGIGPSYAKRIIKFRTLLGGYTKIEQLKDVYGMDEERYNQITPCFTITLDSVKLIALNTSDYSTLRKHPYVSNDLAYEITSYRKLHGQFKEVEDLKKLELMNDSLYQKIYLYFAVEQN